jgi:glycosyltransferase involved in cell wall biosynthesis
MHVLYVNRVFPGQFGHIARHLIRHEGFQCTFVCESVGELPGSRTPNLAPVSSSAIQVSASSGAAITEAPPVSVVVDGIEVIRYQPRGSVTTRTHPCSWHFENSVWHSHAIYQLLQARPDLQPDLVVAFSGLGSAFFLADLYRCPIIDYFECYHAGYRDSYLHFRPEFPPTELDVLRLRTRDVVNLLNLQTCTAGYSPMHWQRQLFPAEYQHKLVTLFDGIDREFWYRRQVPRRIAGRSIPADTRLVTYASPGLEATRGFDIFMRVAQSIAQQRSDVLFVVVGSNAVLYGDELKHLNAPSFLDHVLRQDKYPLDRFLFTGPLPAAGLAEVFSLSDLHIYLTVPFVLSWSLLDALACGCTVLASDTAPVQEVIRHEQNGLLGGFYDVDGLARQALRVLDDPQQFRPLGQAGVRLIDEQYSVAQIMPRMLDFYRRVRGGSFPPPPGRPEGPTSF